MSTETMENPNERAVFNQMAQALSKLPVEVTIDPEQVKPSPEADPVHKKPDAIAPVPNPEPPPKPDAPKPTEKAPEENPLESTKGLSPKAAEKFDAIKKARDEFKTKAEQVEADRKALESKMAELSKQIEEVRKAPANDPEREALKKERDQLNEILNVIRIEEHPEFQKKWNSQIDTQHALAKAIVGPALADKTLKVLAMSDGVEKNTKMEELKAELSEDQLDELKDVRKNLRLINLQRDGEIANSRQNYKQLQEQEAVKRTQSEQATRRMFKEIGDKLSDSKEGWAVFQKTDNVEWNRAVDTMKADAEALFTGNLPVEKVAENAYKAAAFPAMLQFSAMLLQEKAKLEAQVSGMAAASPKTADGGKPVTPTEKSSILGSANPQAGTDVWIKSFMKGLQGEG